MNRSERAKQFMPFSSLRGYYEKILEKQRVKEDKKELDEGKIEEISRNLSSLNVGQMISLTYYNKDHYEKVQGLVSGIDPVGQSLSVVKTRISFSDIFQIKI